MRASPSAGSKFKAVNNRDRNFTRAKVERGRAQLEESVARYLSQLDTADLQEPSEVLKNQDESPQREDCEAEGADARLDTLKVQMLAAPDQQISLTDPMPARWRPAVAALAWGAIMSRSPSTPHII